MAFNLVSPGVKVREVDLTIGRIDSANDQIAGIAGPFQKGPINDPVLISTEQDLLRVFGKPLETDAQNEYWYAASTYLSYGGQLRVVRSDSTELINANVGVSSTSVDVKISTLDDFNNNHSDATTWLYAAKTAGSWGNDLKICTIDNLADQRITGVGTTGVTNTVVTDIATKTGNIAAGSVVGPATSIITGINTSLLAVGQYISNDLYVSSTEIQILSIGVETITLNGTINTDITEVIGAEFDFEERTSTFTPYDIQVGYAVTQTLTAQIANSDGTVSPFVGYVRGLITNIGSDYIDVKITDRIDTDNDTVEAISYKTPGTTTNAFSLYAGNNFNIVSSDGTLKVDTPAFSGIVDWYDQQTLDLDNSVVYWRSIAEKPGTSQYAASRNASNDEIHIVVVDDSGSLTGTAGQIVEKFAFLSKSTDAKSTPSQSIYYKQFLANNSEYIYSGASPTNLLDTRFTGTFDTYTVLGSSMWGVPAQSNNFKVSGPRTYTLTGGYDYDQNGGMSPFLADVVSAYETFRNPAEYSLDYLIAGPMIGDTLYESQAKASAIISIAESRKDCIAVISAHKESVVNILSSDTQTQNIIEFFDALQSSSYAVFDSGYKYTYDRFNNKFLYLACNPDVAGLMARTSANNYPWFSPAGSARGTLNNAIKLAYNPSQSQRDSLYTKRINPIIASPGQGIILYGDKTALGYSSAFDRINVRKLFLTVEKAIERASRSQLFEFNDEITRNNFVNIVEPYLRDVKGKRGITDFVVICDETNNTPDVVDSNRFVADIFIKPARSINFITLTFVATRTGVSFSEIIGTV